MSGWRDAVLRMLAGIALLALNMSVICFYWLWVSANTITGNRAEEHGFDPQQLLPNFMPFYFAAQASMLSLLAFDALVIVIVWRRVRRRRQDLRPGVVTPPEQMVRAGWSQAAAPAQQSEQSSQPPAPPSTQ